MLYTNKAVGRHAAIAQPVERILGKDEVASSNLASSSKKKPGTPTSFRLSSFLCCMPPTLKTDTETDTASFPMQNFTIICTMTHQYKLIATSARRGGDLILYSCLNFVPVGCNLHFDSVFQCLKMLFAAVDLQLFPGTQIHKAVAALGFQNEVQLFFSILS